MSRLLSASFTWTCSMSLHEGRKDVCLMFPGVRFSFSSATVRTGSSHDFTPSEHVELIIRAELSRFN